VEEIERELARIWALPRLLALVGEGEEGRVAVRTSVLNLVVMASRPEIAEHCSDAVARLSGRHPTRTIVFVPADPDGPPWLDATLTVWCQLPQGGGPESCVETIHVRAGGETGRHPLAVVAPLLVHDLPIVVWWPGDVPFGTPPADEILGIADRLIVDGSSWSGDGLDRLAALAALARQGSTAIWDFALARQARWREAIAAVFDLPDLLPFLHHLRRVAVAYATHDPTGGPGSTNVVRPIYHVAWLGSRLGWRVEEPLAVATGPVQRRRGGRSGEGLSILHHGLTARLSADDGEIAVVVRPLASPLPAGSTLRLELLARRRGSELRVEVTGETEAVRCRAWLDGVEGLDRLFFSPRRTELQLLAEGLETMGRDPIARAAISFAGQLIGSVP
jgi:glucose-6-phosphate dehydrogenase assembly protein OpcA